MDNIWIFAEQAGGEIHSSFYELLSKARELFPQAVLTAVAFGGDNTRAIDVLQASGAGAVLSAAHEKLADYRPDCYAETLVRLAGAEKPDVILIAATEIGSELAPTVAARLNTGLAAHCADLCLGDSGELISLIPAFGGKLMGEILIPEARPFMATVKPGVFERHSLPPAPEVKVTQADAGFLDSFQGKIEFLGAQAAEHKAASIEAAEVAVCAGLGISSRENWEKARELARLLKGSLCYTRPVVDMGYTDTEDAMVGTSGKMIRPKLYIGFGVSGASHHVCGMKDSGTIISVNTNEKAEIFNVSDYKFIGDSGAVLDELLAALKN